MPQEADGSELQREAESRIRPSAQRDQRAIGVVEEEVALQLRARRRLREAPIRCELLSGEEVGGHARTTGQPRAASHLRPYRYLCLR